jgi:hypothetical protein
MKNLDDLRNEWKKNMNEESASGAYNEESLHALVKHRVKKHTGMTMRYFWPAFFCQLLVYAMLSHVVVKYWGQAEIVLAGMGGILLFIPFTWVMMKKFKTMATLRVGNNGITTIREYILQHRSLIQSFFRFKQWYELILIPLASLIGVWIVFELFVPGGVMDAFKGALICYVITLVSCAFAVIQENKKNFREPLCELQKVIDDFKQG